MSIFFSTILNQRLQNCDLATWDIRIPYPNLELFINIANALEISADELLVDNLTNSTSKRDGDDLYVLLDCSPEEATILVKNMKALKDILRKYTIK